MFMMEVKLVDLTSDAGAGGSTWPTRVVGTIDVSGKCVCEMR